MKTVMGVIIPEKFLKNKNLKDFKIYENSDAIYTDDDVILGTEIDLDDSFIHISYMTNASDELREWLYSNDLEEYEHETGIFQVGEDEDDEDEDEDEKN